MDEKNRILSTVSLYHAVDDGTISVIPLLLPVFKILFNLNYTQVGILTGGGLLITLIVQLYIGRISDGKNFRIITSTGILLLSVSMLLMTQANSFLSLLLFIFILRMAAAFFHPVGIGWISKTFKKGKIDWAMGVQSGFGDVGAFIAVLTTLYLAEIYGWTFPLYVWAIIGAVGLLFGLYFTKDIDMTQNQIINKPRFNLYSSFDDALKFLKSIKLIVPAFIISGSSWGIVISYLPLLLVERTDISLSYIGLIVAVWIGIGAVISFFYGRIHACIGRKTVIFLAYLGLGLAGFILVYTTSIVVIILLAVVLGISIFLTFPALFSYVSEITHETVEGKTFGYIFTLQLGGGTLLLFLSGALSDIWGIWVPFAILGLIGILMACLLVFNRKKDVVKNCQV